MDKEKKITCSNCGNRVYKHYVVTTGRCWNCGSQLSPYKIHSLPQLIKYLYFRYFTNPHLGWLPLVSVTFSAIWGIR